MSRMSQHTTSVHDPAIRQQFLEFRRRYPQASSRQQLESGILPDYP